MQLISTEEASCKKSATMSLITTEELHSFVVDKTTAQDVIAFLASLLGLQEYQLDVSFVNEADIQEINRTFRSKDRSTDVLSFPQQTWERKPSMELPFQNSENAGSEMVHKILGDLVLCPAVAQESARKIGQSLATEMCFLLVHGILHLCGYDHMNAEDELEMLTQQRAMMKRLKQHECWPVWVDTLIKPIT